MQGGGGETRAACAREIEPRDLIRRVRFTLLVACILLVASAAARARSCVERPLGEYSVIFGARIVQKLPKNKMILAIEHVLRGNETRESLIVDYGNVMVWTDRNVFKPRAKWLFAFQEKAKEYDITVQDSIHPTAKWKTIRKHRR